MSFIQKNSKTKKSKQKSSIDFSNDIKKLEKKITELQHNQSPQFSKFESIIENLQNKINRLEQKNKQLESSVKEVKKIKYKSVNNSENNSEVKILNNVINEDLNKMKIKIEKNEDILKKLLFN